jgi:CheY-like chemotaxis protein
MAKKRHVVLVVDDDDEVRDTTISLLEHYGLEVRSACSGEEGLEAAEQEGDIHLLLTDIRMPGPINGWELAHRAKQRRPDLRVIYMSGYPDQIPFGEHGVGYGPLLPKPWKPDQLREHIRKALALG